MPKQQVKPAVRWECSPNIDKEMMTVTDEEKEIRKQMRKDFIVYSLIPALLPVLIPLFMGVVFL